MEYQTGDLIELTKEYDLLLPGSILEIQSKSLSTYHCIIKEVYPGSHSAYRSEGYFFITHNRIRGCAELVESALSNIPEPEDLDLI